MIFEKLRAAGLLALAGIGLALAGCGGDGTDNNDNTGGEGTLRVRLADAMDPSVTSVNVTFDSVSAHRNGKWQDLDVQETTVDLLELTENDIILAEGTVPTGRYEQVRLNVSNVTVTDSEGTHTAKLPSKMIHLNVHFDIQSRDIMEVLLDWNLDKSLVKTGNGQYILKPVIPVVIKVLSGTITGSTLRPDGSIAPHTHVSAIYTAGPNYPLGTEVNTSISNLEGNFKIWALLPGEYRLEFRHEEADGTIHTATLAGVDVTANTNTVVGPVTLE